MGLIETETQEEGQDYSAMLTEHAESLKQYMQEVEALRDN